MIEREVKLSFSSAEDARAAVQATGADLDREETLLSGAADVGADAPEGLDQRPHRAPPHLGNAIDPVNATGRGGAERGEEARRGAGEADEEIGFADAEGGVLPGDGDRARGQIGRAHV